jgi:hypothetical protein
LRNPYRHFGRIAASLLLLACLQSPLAHAALGEPAESVSADTASMKASLRAVSKAALYTTHELQTDVGTSVHEFVTPSGVVFAVSWRGPFKPDLRALLGRYFDAYATAPRTAGAPRTHVTVAVPDLVVLVSGHMRAFAGLAYVPSLMPANVTAGDLQ